jgi:hypothetical protein
VGGFFGGEGIGGNWYENPAGPLDLTPNAPWWIAGLVVLRQMPPSPEGVAANQAAVDTGWEIYLEDSSPSTTFPSVIFRMVVYGAGSAVVANLTTDPYNVSNLGALGQIFIPFSFGFRRVGALGAGPFGTLLAFGGFPGNTLDLTGAYASNPRLFVGRHVNPTQRELRAPNCLAGLIGGDSPGDFGGATLFDSQNLWADAMVDANEVLPFPGTTLVTTEGWRVPPNVGQAPNPLPSFVGGADLVYGNGPPFGTPLTVGCNSPVVMWPANTEFPFT